MKRATRKSVALIGACALAVAVGTAYAGANDGAAESSTAAPRHSSPSESSYVYRSALQRDTIAVRDGMGNEPPYRVATVRRLEMWTAPSGDTLFRQTCLSARNADASGPADEADPSAGQACQTLEHRMSRAQLDMGGLLGSDPADLAGRIASAAGTDASPVERAALAASVALNPAATAAQRKAAEDAAVAAAGPNGTTAAPGGARSVRVTEGENWSVQLEFDPETGEVAAYREYTADGQALSERTLERISVVEREGEVPSPVSG